MSAIAVVALSAVAAQAPAAFALEVSFVVEHAVPAAGTVPTRVTASSILHLSSDGRARNEICHIELHGDSDLVSVRPPARLADSITSSPARWWLDERGRLRVDLGEQHLRLNPDTDPMELSVGGLGLFKLDVEQRLRVVLTDFGAARGRPLVPKFSQRIESQGALSFRLDGWLAADPAQPNWSSISPGMASMPAPERLIRTAGTSAAYCWTRRRIAAPTCWSWAPIPIAAGASRFLGASPISCSTTPISPP